MRAVDQAARIDQIYGIKGARAGIALIATGILSMLRMSITGYWKM
jgi:hypothetical protein